MADLLNTREGALAHFLSLPYRMEVIKSEHGDFVISYPELPGCMTQIDDFAEVGATAKEILAGWLELALEDGQQIPEPAHENSDTFHDRLSE